MIKNPALRIHAMSVFLGALLGMTGFALLGASPTDTAVSATIMPQRFLVLEATPKRSPANPKQSVLQLRVSPHYGKIDEKGLRFRMENETQELTMLISIKKAGEEISRGDIVSFEEFKHRKLSPGSKIVRHLPSGDTELVP